jgi:hypothetical protein
MRRKQPSLDEDTAKRTTTTTTNPSPVAAISTSRNVLAILAALLCFSGFYIVYEETQQFFLIPSTRDAPVSGYDESSESSTVFCESIPLQISNVVVSDPTRVTQLRRHLALVHPSCLDLHFSLFARAFQDRPFRNHVQLHIPKAAGTTLCDYIKEETNISTPGGNCWTGQFCPLWCGCQHPNSTTCQTLNNKKMQKYSFVMNENWLDGFCGGSHTYSMLLRDPVTRAMSHVNHYLDAIAARGHKHFQDTKGWRLSLIQFNYMTWSLTAGQYANKMEHPTYFRPTEDHLPGALSTLEQIDFLLDLGMANQECLNVMLYFLGIYDSPNSTEVGEYLGKSNSYGSTYKKGFAVDEYKAMNQLDQQVYDYAQKIVEVDCIFFHRILEQRSTGTSQV